MSDLPPLPSDAPTRGLADKPFSMCEFGHEYPTMAGICPTCNAEAVMAFDAQGAERFPVEETDPPS